MAGHGLCMAVSVRLVVPSGSIYTAVQTAGVSEDCSFDISGAQVQREKERWIRGTFWIQRDDACHGLGVCRCECVHVCFSIYLFVYFYLDLY